MCCRRRSPASAHRARLPRADAVAPLWRRGAGPAHLASIRAAGPASTIRRSKPSGWDSAAARLCAGRHRGRVGSGLLADPRRADAASRAHADVRGEAVESAWKTSPPRSCASRTIVLGALDQSRLQRRLRSTGPAARPWVERRPRQKISPPAVQGQDVRPAKAARRSDLGGVGDQPRHDYAGSGRRPSEGCPAAASAPHPGEARVDLRQALSPPRSSCGT